MLGVFAEFETNLRKERQAESIAKAKAAGVYKGRPPSIDASKVREMRKTGLGPSKIAKALKLVERLFIAPSNPLGKAVGVSGVWLVKIRAAGSVQENPA